MPCSRPGATRCRVIGGDTGRAPDAVDLGDYAGLVPGWNPESLGRPTEWADDEVRRDVTRDIIDQATGLVRLTHNRALVHRDVDTTAFDRRLVYGGHVQALSQASLTRIEPRLATIVAWHACSHVGPAFEGDLLSFDHRLITETSGSGGMSLRAYETIGYADRPADGAVGPATERHEILRWIPVAVVRT